MDTSTGKLYLVPRNHREEVMPSVVGDYFDSPSASSALKSSSGGSLPANDSASRARGTVAHGDNFVKLDDIFNRAYDELDMLVAKAQSKRQD